MQAKIRKKKLKLQSNMEKNTYLIVDDQSLILKSSCRNVKINSIF